MGRLGDWEKRIDVDEERRRKGDGENWRLGDKVKE